RGARGAPALPRRLLLGIRDRSGRVERGERLPRPALSRAGACANYNPGVASERQIHVGPVPIGGGAPVAVQTMTKTETANLAATMDQIVTVAEAGADIVRVAVPREQDAEALKTIVERSPIPI